MAEQGGLPPGPKDEMRRSAIVVMDRPEDLRQVGHLPRRSGALALLLLALSSCGALLAPGARAASPPAQDPFYTYQGSTPIADIAPGTVLKTRVELYHVAEIAVPIEAVQLLYRSTGELGQPTVNVTSVLEPPIRLGPPTVVSYQSAYDSLNTEDDPSYAISGGPISLGSLLPNLESVLIAPSLLAGDAVVVPDTEGENADFAAGPEYGMNTLDSLRAALSSSATGLEGARIGMIGYSGGAIATEWAAELAPSYAPEINSSIVGAAFGGTLVDPAHNLHYIEGSSTWAGVMPMALVGVARSFHDEITPYLSEYGLQLFNQLQGASIAEVLDAYPGLTWAQLSKPEYPTPESIPVYVTDSNQLIMGSRGTPTTPLFIGQGAGGELEGTEGNKPGIGRGDGVMIAGDVRSLAREYCGRGVTVQYVEYENLSHVLAAAPWLVEANAWLDARLLGLPAPQDCSTIAPGNSLAPIAASSGVPSSILTDKKLNEPTVLPTGTFRGSVNLSTETGAGSVSGNLSVPSFSAPIKLYGLLPVTFGMSMSQVGSLTGTVAKSAIEPGEDALQIPAKLRLGITSVSVLNLKIPTDCWTTEAVSFNFESTLPREELANVDWTFAGAVTLPAFECKGGFLGPLFGPVLTSLISGPENTYSWSIRGPGG